MKTTADWLAALSARLGGASDYRIAITLGISRHVVSHWRTGNATIGDDAAIKIASVLECDPAEILISAACERAKNALVRDAWRAAFDKVRGVAAALALLGFSLFFSPSPASANMPTVSAQCPDALYYVKSALRHAVRIAARLARSMTVCIFPSGFRPSMP